MSCEDRLTRGGLTTSDKEEEQKRHDPSVEEYHWKEAVYSVGGSLNVK